MYCLKKYKCLRMEEKKYFLEVVRQIRFLIELNDDLYANKQLS